MIESITRQINIALQHISQIPKPLKLVVVIGPEGSGKSTLIRYCCGNRYSYQEIDGEHKFVSLDNSTPNNSSIEILTHENIIFFEWRLFQRLSDLEETAERFLLSHLLKSVDSVSWVSTIDYCSIEVGYAPGFKRFYELFDEQELLTEEVKKSTRWIITRRPEGGILLARHLLKKCQKIVPNCFSQMADLLVTDHGQPREDLLNALMGRSTSISEARASHHQMLIPLNINEHAVAILQCALSNSEYALVSNFFLDKIDLFSWLQYSLTTQNPLNDLLVAQLVRRLMILRMSDPYDDNYQHRVVERAKSLTEMIESLPVVPSSRQSVALKKAGLILQRYHAGANEVKEEELLTLCRDLESSEVPLSAESAEVEVLSQGVQAALITSYNQHILEKQDPHFETQLELVSVEEQAISSWDNHLFVFNKMLSTFRMFGLLQSSDVQLIQETISQFNHLANEQWEGGDAKKLLKHLCTLLRSLNSSNSLEQGYLQPLLYLLDDNQQIIPEHSKLPLSHGKLVALKQLYQTANSLFHLLQQLSPALTSDFFIDTTEKISHALLVLTDQEPLLSNWLSYLLLKNNGNTTEEIVRYFSEKILPFKVYVGYIKEMEPWLNLAISHASNSLPEEVNLNEAKKNIFHAIKAIITQIDNDYEVNVEAKFDEEVARDLIMLDIEHEVDFLQMTGQSGFTRYYPLLIIASKYYERMSLKVPLHYLLSLTPLVRLIHQLSSVRNISELHTILKEFQESEAISPISEQLDPFLQMLDLCRIVSTSLKELNQTTDKIEFSINLIAKIENHLPTDLTWSETLRPWLITAKVVLNGYPQMHVETAKRLVHLKTQEKEIKQLPKFSEEAQAALRLLISAQYLSDDQSQLMEALHSGNWQQCLSEILRLFVEPLAIIWEQHEITATVIFVPHFIQAVSDISALSRQSLSIENGFKPILNAIENTNKIFDQREKDALLIRDLSHICRAVHTLNNYLKTGNRLYECYQTGKVILTKLKSLEFCQKRLEEMGSGTTQLVKGIKLTCSAIQSGDLETTKTAIQQTQSLFSQISTVAGGATNVVANVAGAAVSCTTVLGAVNLVASVANIAVTVYYSRKIMAKVNEIETKVDRLGEQQEKLIRYAEASQVELQKISAQIDREINKLDQNISLFKNEMSLSFHQMKLHQEHILYEMKKGFDQLYRGLEELNDQRELARLKDKILPMIRSSEMLNEALKEEDFSKTLLKDMRAIYLDLLSSDTGLSNCEFNGMGANVGLARKLFFLQPLFQESQNNLPNLIVWIQSCLAVNNFLKCCSEYHSSQRMSLKEKYLANIQEKHIEIIKKTFQILETLDTTTTKSYIVQLLDRLKNNQAKNSTSDYEHIHLISRLCGFPLHQFGESGFELWKLPEEELSEIQQRQKILLETAIVQALENIMSSPDSPKSCSRFVLSVQSLLRELIEVGMSIFPAISENLNIRKIYSELSLQPRTRVLCVDEASTASKVDESFSRRSIIQSYNTRGVGFLGALSIASAQIRENTQTEISPNYISIRNEETSYK